VTTPNIQKMLKEHFYLSIEQSVINTLLRRCRKRGYLTRKDGVYFRNESTLKQLNFTQIENEVLANHIYLLSSFIEFCKETFQLNIDNEKAEEMVYSFLEQNGLLIMQESKSLQAKFALLCS